ncbi:uncharacterized protein EV422DRAFT_213864 [Fimicolochytrium jonesii]|uniref:uncharacterized protein n=1 Tax=Fimicolochytrium jonesii TaxID=1396493 RepID=UPI0022FDEF69|nr:uncharacterized protein EV422DRAFT_213864 [Fimicolochytrium jonesii]KAI8817733.1 hypothetical protein EV422DRAFT_213864 [Fimicolochytrium jonesii]
MQRVQERSVGQSPTRNIVFTWLSAVYVAKEIYAHSLRSLRRRLILGVTLDLLVDLMFCILYLIEFEIDRNHRDRVADLSPSWLYVARPSTLWNMELSCSSYMVWSQINKIIIADSKREAMFNHRIALDLFICAPFLFLPLYEYGHYVYIPFYLRAVVVVNRIQNVIRLAASRKWIWVEPYTERLVFLISTILALMYVASCAFQYFETRFAEQEITLSQALYFIVITASTVGYGDVSPKSIPGQFVVIVFIILAISILPGLISQTIETLHLRNSGRGTYQRGKSPFVVFVGNFSKTISVIDIIHTFVAREQDRPLNLVFMGRDEPSAAVKAIVRREGFTHRCTYLQGNVLEVQDMERAQIQHAAAAFIIADRNAPDHLIEDDENTLRAWAIDDHAPDVPLFVYNLLPETEILQTHSANEAVCIDNLKQILIGFNLIYRGIGTVLLNLLVQTKPRREYEAPWEAQYGDGLGNELYSGPVNPVFYGFEFQRASYFLFRQYQVICFAVRAVLDNGETHLILNPAGYKLGKKDLLYYVAQRQEDIDDIAHLGREELGFCLQMPNPHSFILEPGCVRQGSMQAVIGENKGQDGNKTMNGWRVGVPVVAQGGVKLPLCLLLKHPIRNLDELLLQDGSHLTNHILVCTGDKHVFRLLCTLRAAHLSDDEFRTVVVLCSTLPNAYEISLFGQFPEVYIVQGDPRKRAELQKAGIHGADKVVVMNMNRKSVNADGVEGFDTFADSAAIMVSHNIYHMFQNTGDHKFTVTELPTSASCNPPTAAKSTDARKPYTAKSVSKPTSASTDTCIRRPMRLDG